ncbi:membrane protein insertase YidC [Ideonella sp. 4Y16]|uniref:Membrane protein insertase YidC n=1 Tax=Ideonella alba TaxID=2824118 RepID=A0A940Y3H0_9BURK|nr:membrane protein insertase YidC [Ideonella alba]MBQ0929047.1 membrane protein insertase YidC [Ideonella alba]MBQ0942991.1 membrane protein insertase YidC [Ideonella alba]
MNDIRRNFLWVVFAMSLVLLWDAWNKHNGEPTLFGAPIAATPASAASAAPGGVPASATQPAAAAAATTAAAPANDPGELVVLQTDVLRLTLASRGGDVVRAELLAYPDDQDKSQPVVLMDRSANRTYLAQTGFIGTGLPSHFTLLSAQPGERTLKDGASELSVVFASPEANGVQWTKTLTLRRGQYAIDVKNELRNTGAAAVDAQIYLQLQRDGTPPPGGSSFYSTFTGPAIYSDEKKFQKVEFKDIDKRKPGEAPSHITKAQDGWVAMVQHYFTSAWLVNTPGAREFVTKKDKDNLYSVALVQPLGSVAPGATATHQAQLYVGPQEENRLAALAPGLELVKDYGVLHILAKPLFWVLDQLHKLIGNWGWAIVGLVVLLKIAFYWLNASAYKSMAKMKAVNPRIMELRERLKDKPQEMQQEMMRIYREEKVNPLGGCLPIFIQMPFFMALYWVLMATVEMRGAPWIWWIHDLAAIDPYYILPAVMTATSLLQVWLGPKAGDEMQQKMMWMMPLIFGVMFFFFPAGLVLYWLTNNILSIAQQWWINKRLGVN